MYLFMLIVVLSNLKYSASFDMEPTRASWIAITNDFIHPEVEPFEKDAREQVHDQEKEITTAESPLKTSPYPLDMSNSSSTNETIVSMAKKHPLWKGGVYMHQYYLPLLVPIGFTGNILSFLVMIQRHNRRNSCCNYIAALSVTDFCMIYVAAHYWVVTSGFFRGIYYYECKMLAWTFNLFSLMGIALIVFMTFDRFIAVRFPFSAPTVCTPRRARITIATIVLGMIAYTGPYLYTAGLVNNNTCAAITKPTTFTTVYSWINMFVVSVLPFCSLLTMNVFIIYTIRNRRKYFSKDQATKSEDDNKDAQLTFMLLLVTFTFLLLTLPLYVRYVLTIVLDYKSDVFLYALYIFLYHLSNKLYFTNNAINFYLYCIGGAKFRADLARLCGKKPEKSASSVNSSVVTANTTKEDI